MSRLFHAGFNRLVKDKIFWIGTALTVLFCVLVCANKYRDQFEYEVHYTLDMFLFGSLMIIGIVLSVFISLFIGTEYADGTIRNKLIAGHGRSRIYLSNFLLCLAAAAVCALLSVFITIAIGIPMFGFFTTKPGMLFLLFADYLMAAFAYASVFLLVSMLCQNKAYASVLNILLAFCFLFIGIYLYSRITAPEMIEMAELAVNGEIQIESVPNPQYLTGMKREIYQFFLDFIPGGQAMQIAQWDVIHPYRLPLYSAIIIFVANAAGLVFFRKKDIK